MRAYSGALAAAAKKAESVNGAGEALFTRRADRPTLSPSFACHAFQGRTLALSSSSWHNAIAMVKRCVVDVHLHLFFFLVHARATCWVPMVYS